VVGHGRLQNRFHRRAKRPRSETTLARGLR
jgi:hypothetical protein